MIVSFLNQNGGVSKSTLSVNVAGYLAQEGNRVLLIDADKQGSASTWESLREDAPSHSKEVARSYIFASDFVALPIERFGLSTWASNLTVCQVTEAQEFKPSLKYGFVVSRKIGKTVIGRDIRNMVAEAGLPILSSEIEQRVAFAEGMTMGQTIFKWAPGSNVAHEIEHLTKEIERHVEEDVFSGSEAKNAAYG